MLLFDFVYPKDRPKVVQILIKEGPYEGTLFQYGRVKVEEKNEQGYLLFNYDVISSPVEKPRKLEKNAEFKEVIGNLLLELITNAHKEQDGSDEAGTDDIEESHPE